MQEVKYKLVPIEPDDSQQAAGAGAIRIDTTVINKMFTANRVYRDMVAAAPEQPSDLEIVQKALLKTDQYVDLMGDGRWYVCDKYTRSNGPSGEDNASLLTWAKQTIEGVE